MSKPCIICKNVAFAYDGRAAVTDVSFTLNCGDYLCILGENGTGKSTVVKGLVGLTRPVSGEIEYIGTRKDQIGYLPQCSAIPEGFPASCFEVVLQGRGTKKLFYSKNDKKEAKRNMELLGISELKNKCFSELSGGQKQRVLLARALCATERLLLLDEPVSALDPVVTAEMYSLIAKLNREHAITIVMISHDTATAAKYATHILHMKEKPLFYGKPEDYLETELSKEFLGGCGHTHHHH